ncbi:MAG: hypothetical protein EZS28_012578 [Streblomastix strix]|uniref:Uncharacterized protein n=1 Tax=Streblomastix strix TaxID=222440 RepID=A0A5J4WAC9_9EUKA|nr:MAG: hypothetical protein EZS28_012578 [Streblomastix strix]
MCDAGGSGYNEARGMKKRNNNYNIKEKEKVNSNRNENDEQDDNLQFEDNDAGFGLNNHPSCVRSIINSSVRSLHAMLLVIAKKKQTIKITQKFWEKEKRNNYCDKNDIVDIKISSEIIIKEELEERGGIESLQLLCMDYTHRPENTVAQMALDELTRF